jgi:uncharacterized membrane protein YraQ (UPF0718 family)
MQLVDLLLGVLGQVWGTLQHNWPFLVVSAFVAAAMKLYLNQGTVAGFLRRHEKGGVLAATAAAVGTPLCSCGTTAVVLGMMAGSMPWAPIIAFMVASPLTSPEELIYSAGLFGWPFATAFFVASILLGLAGGVAGAVLDACGWLRNQGRFTRVETACGYAGIPEENRVTAARPAPMAVATSRTENWNSASARDSRLVIATSGESMRLNGCGCDTVLPLFAVAPEPCACGSEAAELSFPARIEAGCRCNPGATRRIALTSASDWQPSHEPMDQKGHPANEMMLADEPAVHQPRFAWSPFLHEVVVTGCRLLIFFLAFAAIGYLINDLIPTAWIMALFGSGHAYSVPLAATLGLPFYINTEASLPLVRGMLTSGMSAGAALAFLITGAGTSIGAVAGAMTIARWRVIGLVIGTLWVGAILCGFAYDALLATGLF